MSNEEIIQDVVSLPKEVAKKVNYINDLIDSHMKDVNHVLPNKKVIDRAVLADHIVKKAKSLVKSIKDDEVQVNVVITLIEKLKRQHIATNGIRSRINHLDAQLVNLV